jgi:hypothetical protein
MNEALPSRSPQRRIIIGGLIATGIVFLSLLYTLREAGLRAVVSRDISNWIQVDSAVHVYRMERGRYPASLDEPDLQPYFDDHVVAFLREGRITYHFPAADSPPTFILVHMTTPRGDYSTRLDGTRLYPDCK